MQIRDGYKLGKWWFSSELWFVGGPDQFVGHGLWDLMTPKLVRIASIVCGGCLHPPVEPVVKTGGNCRPSAHRVWKALQAH